MSIRPKKNTEILNDSAAEKPKTASASILLQFAKNYNTQLLLYAEKTYKACITF